jgi:hypothetical protein
MSTNASILHWIAEILFTVGNPAAVETDILGVFCHILDLLEKLLTRKHTEMPLVIALAYFFSHNFSPRSGFLRL